MATTTRDAIEELLQTYGETGGINYLAAAASLPSRLSIEAACTELMSLMFPGFRSEALVSSEDLADTTRIRVRHLHARLKTEICRSLGRIPPDEATEAKAEEVLAEFFKQLPSVRRRLWTDIDAAYEGDPAATTYEEIILAYPALEAIAIYRMAHLLYGKVPLIPRIMTEWAHSRTGIDIHPGATIGTHFFIDHGTGVVIGETCRIGHHVQIYHGVTLGGTSWNKGKRHPTLGDGVVVGAGAKILGPITVGRGAKIGSNAVVVKDVPECATAVGIPARILDDESQNAREQSAAKMGFSAYGIGEDANDPVVKAIHGLIDHTVAADLRIEYILEQLSRMGVKVEDARATADKFDPTYLNRIVD
jgi:serine O-acetyltransferase